jgi:DNA-binding IclR family transcriptional regulator
VTGPEGTRAKVLDALVGRRMGLSLAEISTSTGCNQKTVSNHLSMLAREGLVFQRRRGVWVHSSYKDPNPWR